MSAMRISAASSRAKANRKTGFLGDERGLAAVEFALILPTMLFIYLGLVELSRGVRAGSQIDGVASTIADLMGQAPATGAAPAQLTAAYVQGVFAAGVAMLAPLDPTSLTMTVSEINITPIVSPSHPPPYAYATVTWSFSYNGGRLRDATATSGCTAATATLGAGNTLNTSLPYTNPTTLVVTPMPSPIALNYIPSNYVSDSTVTAHTIIVADVTYTYVPIVMFPHATGLFGTGAAGKLFTGGGLLMKRTAYGTVRNTFSGGAGPITDNHIQYTSTAQTALLSPFPQQVGRVAAPVITSVNCVAPTL